jgi:hypothetical protein
MTVRRIGYVLLALFVFIVLWMVFFSIGSGEVDVNPPVIENR